MSHAVDRRLEELLDRAEEGRSCLVLSQDESRLRRALSRRVATGELTSPTAGLFVRTEAWLALRPDARARFLAHGLQRLHPDWVFCGPTAALAYGIDVSFPLLGSIHLATPPGEHGGLRGIVTRHPVLGREAAGGIEVADGLRVTSPEQTVLDCLRWTDFPHGLGVADSALRRAVTGRAELERYAARHLRGMPGTRRALDTLSWADPRSENGGGANAGARMLMLGYVCPELQVEVPRVIEGGGPYRADFCWVRADGLVILGELDGKVKYTEEEFMGGRDLEEVLSDENVRGSRLTLYDVSLMRFRFGVTASPALFSAVLDEYGVPRRGSALALPEGTPMIPDWDRPRRNLPH